MRLEFYNETEMQNKFDKLGWDLWALIGMAETWARGCTDKFGVDDFVYEDRDGYYYFDLQDSGTVNVTVKNEYGEELIADELYFRDELKDKVYARFPACDIDIEEVEEPIYKMRMYLK